MRNIIRKLKRKQSIVLLAMIDCVEWIENTDVIDTNENCGGLFFSFYLQDDLDREEYVDVAIDLIQNHSFFFEQTMMLCENEEEGGMYITDFFQEEERSEIMVYQLKSWLVRYKKLLIRNSEKRYKNHKSSKGLLDPIVFPYWAFDKLTD